MIPPSAIYDNIVADILSGFPFDVTPPRKYSDLTKTPNFEDTLNSYLNVSEKDSVPEVNVSGSDSDRISYAISLASKKYNIDENLIKAVIKQESDYNQYCVSSAGAVGLMQLMPSTAETVGVTDRFDIEQNIDGGVHYLRYMLDKFDGNLELALAGYNAGPNAVLKYSGVPPYKETQNYIPKVLGYMEKYNSGLMD